MNLDRNYVRLNEFPEWFVVDENARYDVTRSRRRVDATTWSGTGARGLLSPGDWVVSPAAAGTR